VQQSGKWGVHGEISRMTKLSDITVSESKNNAEWEAAWKAKQKEVQQAMSEFVPEYQKIDPTAQVRIRGSLATGVKMNPDKKSASGEQYAFNPSDFDIDAYVVSEKIFLMGAKGKPALIARGEMDGRDIPETAAIITKMQEKLAGVTGNRDTGSKKSRFYVVIRTTTNARDKVLGDRREMTRPGIKLPEKRGVHLSVPPPIKKPNP
jgi:hypothetical protein